MQEISWNQAIELGSPYPYTLLVTLDKAGKPNIMGLSWWTIVSWDPQMMAVSVAKRNYSHDCLKHCKEFVICFPSKGQEKGAWLCGTKSGRDIDKFEQGGFTPIPAKNVKPPLIQGSTVAFECKVINDVDTGDHTLFIADIVGLHGSPDSKEHLFSVHYSKLVSIGSNGTCDFDIEFK
nr:flavin reductase family protein [Desulfobacterales bacterium]